MDEVYLTIRGKKYYLWRAVDQDSNVLDILVQSRRNKKAAKRFFRKLRVRLQYVPRVIITDKLKSYGAAKREILPGVEHRQHKGLNNRAENSHKPHPRHDCARRKCVDSNQQSMHNAFFLLIAPDLGAFSTTKTPSVCWGIPCHFTDPIPDLE
jgi:putative transposase